jgi:hypothetical protein
VTGDVKEDVKFFGAIALGLVILISIVIGGVYVGSAHSCSRRAGGLGVEHRYGLFEGCLVELNGRYVPIDNYVEAFVTERES